MDDAAGDHVLGLGGIGRHVRRRCVGLEGVRALPLLDHHERVGTERRLELADVRCVSGRAVLDATLLGVTAGMLARNSRRMVSRRPGLAVMMTMTWIMGSSLSLQLFSRGWEIITIAASRPSCAAYR
jgi:hypothetical protein